jgi:ParB-like chromosome segregation protein Spo0J
MSTNIKTKAFPTGKLKFHPLSELFPVLEPDKLEELSKDIRAHGLHEPILLFEGQIIDGRNRYLACKKAKVKMQFESVMSGDPHALVASLNLHRRHLDDSQRARLAAEFVTNKKGRKGSNDPLSTIAEAAKAANVSEPSVKRAKIVKDKGNKALNKAVLKGSIAVSRAAKIAKLPKNKQTLEMRKPRGGLANDRKKKSVEAIQYNAYIDNVKQDGEQIAKEAREFAKREQEKAGIANPVISPRHELILAIEEKWPGDKYNETVNVGVMVEEFLTLVRRVLA